MKRYQNLLMLIVVVVLVVLPLWTVGKPAPGPDGKEVEIFTGADAQATNLVGEIAPSYQPWVNPLLEPPSGEIESLLFALQAALGAGFIGYYLGVSVTRARMREESDQDVPC